MPRRHIYVPATQEKLCHQATAMAGSFSAAVLHGLALYVAERRAPRARMRVIELTVGRGARRVRKRFEGEEIGELDVDSRRPGRLEGITVYATRGGRLVGWRWSDPDWGAWARLSSPSSDPGSVGGGVTLGDEDAGDEDAGDEDAGDEDAYDGPEADDWHERRGTEFVVADDADALCAAMGIEDDVRETIRQRHVRPEVERLEI